ncbi:unnamed protein product [Pleuronectes platessa]|uniref:Uncharacterized protein n=1 Tax=Pleuronectes platessa TaxID=8262 RepID=A0A9N7Z216_PLEPL|nr:unnamed protein product [Pleuronectes platessa]
MNTGEFKQLSVTVSGAHSREHTSTAPEIPPLCISPPSSWARLVFYACQADSGGRWQERRRMVQRVSPPDTSDCGHGCGSRAPLQLHGPKADHWEFGKTF